MKLSATLPQKNKPYILATGASTMSEVREAVKTGLHINDDLAYFNATQITRAI